MVAVRRNLVSVIAAVSVGLSLACDTQQPAHARAVPLRTDTRRMADTLAVLSAKALAEPMSNPFLNHARAQSLRVTIAAEGGGPANLQHAALARRRAAQGGRDPRGDGRARDAWMRDARVSADTITDQKKALFELRAIASLRLGEQENCLGTPVSNRCIPPPRGSRATHARGRRTRC